MTEHAWGPWVGVGGRVVGPDPSDDVMQGCVVEREPGVTGRFAAAVDAFFEAGRRYRAHIRLTVDPAETTVRAEIHGHLSRANGIFLEVDPATGTSRGGHEVEDPEVQVECAAGDAEKVRLDMSFTFTASASGRRHVYAFAYSADRLTVCSLNIEDLDLPDTVAPDAAAVLEVQQDVHVALVEWFRIENYLHVRLEYAHAGTPVTGLRLAPATRPLAATVIGRRAATRRPRRRSRDSDGWLTPQWRDVIEESPALEAYLGAAGSGCGYRIDILLDDTTEPRTLAVADFGPRQGLLIQVLHLDGTAVTLEVAELARRSSDLAEIDLLQPVLDRNPRARILEIGGNGPRSQARKASITARFPECTYLTMDVNDGPAVDVVGDAQFLDRYFPPGSFDVVHSVAVLEHVSSVELVPRGVNRVLAIGGLALMTAPQTFPMHAEPTDFWRFTDHGLAQLFGPAFGFAVEGQGVRTRCRVVPQLAIPGAADPSMQVHPAYLTAFVRARKVFDLGADGPAYGDQRRYDPQAYVFDL